MNSRFKVKAKSPNITDSALTSGKSLMYSDSQGNDIV